MHKDGPRKKVYPGSKHYFLINPLFTTRLKYGRATFLWLAVVFVVKIYQKNINIYR